MIAEAKQLCTKNIFSNLWPFDPEINRAHPQLMGSLCVKYHDYRCEDEPLCGKNHFQESMHFDLDLWTLKSIGHNLKKSLVGCKGKAVMRLNNVSTESRTDRVIPVYPPNFIAGVEGGGGVEIWYPWKGHKYRLVYRLQSLAKQRGHIEVKREAVNFFSAWYTPKPIAIWSLNWQISGVVRSFCSRFYQAI